MSIQRTSHQPDAEKRKKGEWAYYKNGPSCMKYGPTSMRKGFNEHSTAEARASSGRTLEGKLDAFSRQKLK
jgi:hypothetical protein